jgi:hypothetical protein
MPLSAHFAVTAHSTCILDCSCTAVQDRNTSYYYVHACDRGGTTGDKHGGIMTRQFVIRADPSGTLRAIFTPMRGINICSPTIRHYGHVDVGRCSLQCAPAALSQIARKGNCSAVLLQVRNVTWCVFTFRLSHKQDVVLLSALGFACRLPVPIPGRR